VTQPDESPTLRDVVAALGAPVAVRAAMPELRYEWRCGCCVVVDSDVMERRWDRCAAHARWEARRSA